MLIPAQQKAGAVVRHFKLIILRLLLTIFTSLLLTQSFCQTSSVTGYVFDLATEKPLAGTKVDLHTVPDNKSIATTVTDSLGHFAYENIKSGNYSLSCFYKMTAERTYLKEVKDSLGRSDIDSSFTIASGQAYNHVFHLGVTCPYDKTKDLDFCPNCKKKDMVQPILWGLVTMDKDGKSMYDLDKYYLGGCSPDIWCNPTKHCKRCNLSF